MKPEETLVVVVSPYRAANGRSRQAHGLFARTLLNRLARAGYLVFASHVFCTEFLDEDVAADRENGLRIERGIVARSDRLAVWDLWGMSSGMKGAIDWAGELNKIRIAEEERLWAEGIHGIVSGMKPIIVSYASRGEVPEWADLIDRDERSRP